MDKIRILVVGLEPEDINSIKDSLGLGYLVIAYDMLPTVKLVHIPQKPLHDNPLLTRGLFKT